MLIKSKSKITSKGFDCILIYHIYLHLRSDCIEYYVLMFYFLFSSPNQHQSCPQVQDCSRVHSKSCISYITCCVGMCLKHCKRNSRRLRSFALCFFSSLTPSSNSCQDISEQLQKRSSGRSSLKLSGWMFVAQRLLRGLKVRHH